MHRNGGISVKSQDTSPRLKKILNLNAPEWRVFGKAWFDASFWSKKTLEQWRNWKLSSRGSEGGGTRNLVKIQFSASQGGGLEIGQTMSAQRWLTSQETTKVESYFRGEDIFPLKKGAKTFSDWKGGGGEDFFD